MLALLAALAAGLLVGRVQGVRAFVASAAFKASRGVTLGLLIAAMGFRIGRTDEVIRNAGTLGLTALALAAATVAGTILVLLLLFTLRGPRGVVRDKPPSGADARVSWLHILRDPLALILVLAAGFCAGRFIRFMPDADGSALITWTLYALLALIGMGLSGSAIRLGEIVTHPDLVLIPLGTIVGSLVGGLIVGIMLGMRPGTALSVSSGFGWYSLSGVILTRLDGPRIGAISFLSNMLRESMALVLIPLLGRSRFPALAIGAGGATSMDVTLPLIEKSCGPRAVAFAVASGGVLSLSVPVLVPLLFSIGG